MISLNLTKSTQSFLQRASVFTKYNKFSSNYIRNTRNFCTQANEGVQESKKSPKKFVFGDVVKSLSTITSETPNVSSFQGYKKLNSMKREYDDFIINEEKLNLEKLHKMFVDKYIQTLKALCTFNETDFPKIEPNFNMELIRKFYPLKGKYFVAQDLEGFSAQNLKVEAKILETNLIKGVNVIRGKNLPKEVVNTDFTFEKNGQVIYFPQKNYVTAKLKADAGEIVLRLYVEITCPEVLNVTKDDQTNDNKDSGQNSNKFTHLVIFENQLRMPIRGSIFKLMEEHYLKQYRVNDNEWYISDINGIFKGNKFLYSKDELKDQYAA